MFAWLSENYGTVLICALLIAAVAGVLVYMIRGKKRGKSVLGCDGDCGECKACRANRFIEPNKPEK